MEFYGRARRGQAWGGIGGQKWRQRDPDRMACQLASREQWRGDPLVQFEEVFDAVAFIGEGLRAVAPVYRAVKPRVGFGQIGRHRKRIKSRGLPTPSLRLSMPARTD